MNTLTAEEQARVISLLRPQEELLWVGKPLADTPEQRPTGLLGRLCSLLSSKTQSFTTRSTLYLLTAKRAIVVPVSGEPQEWPLMLGMIQKVNEEPDGSGDVIFDHDYNERTETRTPRGFLRVADVERVRMLVSSAADAAYNASPWSV
ncbi:MAG: hypothetical protein IJN29_00195 [Akkermansia sp.]|nr:hypothetical protein [Akkermansia sp.]